MHESYCCAAVLLTGATLRCWWSAQPSSAGCDLCLLCFTRYCGTWYLVWYYYVYLDVPVDLLPLYLVQFRPIGFDFWPIGFDSFRFRLELRKSFFSHLHQKTTGLYIFCLLFYRSGYLAQFWLRFDSDSSLEDPYEICRFFSALLEETNLDMGVEILYWI